MKTLSKISCLLFSLSALSLNSFGQIKVSNNNYVGINYSSTPLSRFVINSAGSSAYQAYIYNPTISTTGGALATISDKGTSGGNHIVGHYSQTYIGCSNYFYGIKSVANNSSPTSSGRAYGVYGLAGNATTGFNYAVYGSLYGTNYGAAIFGAINGSGDVGLTAQFAGYFRGNVKCENIIYAAQFITQPSDERFKTNISEIDPKDAIENISKINPVKYNLKQYDLIQKSGDTTSITKYYNESDPLFIKAKFGVIAQDLQKIYPDLVFQDGEGNLSVDYMGMIPIMIKVIQSQQKKIEEFDEKITLLTKEINDLKLK
jgi:hypothetical protein